MRIETERGSDGRWEAAVLDLPGDIACWGYGDTEEEARIRATEAARELLCECGYRDAAGESV